MSPRSNLILHPCIELTWHCRYTLAVGKAPFHASSKDEIYRKLRAGDYSWPELCSITNDISADLRDLVSSLLVVEDLRPCPDQIVSHPFFKIAYVPKKMSRSQLQKAPIWPSALPSPEVIQRGYSDSWWHVCKESGVGEYLPGKYFQLTSGKRIRSVVRDIEREVAAGRQPVLPIPHDTVYTTFPYSGTWATQNTRGLEEIAEERDVPAQVRHLKDISNNEVHIPQINVSKESVAESESRKQIDAELMPPPPPCARRPGTVRKLRTAQEATIRGARFRPVEPESQPQDPQISAGTLSRPGSLPQSVEGTVTAKRSADASLARRPRTYRNPPASREVAASNEVIIDTDNAHTQPALPVRSVPRSRAKALPTEVIEIYDEEAEPQRGLSCSVPPRVQESIQVSKKTRLLSPQALPGTSPAIVLDRLCVFRDNLAASIEKKRLPPSRRILNSQNIKPLPFVSRWVDYSRKHGVGYVLEDGTVGYIDNGSPKAGTPVTHVVVRNGELWLRQVGRKFENVEKIPFHVLEDCGLDGVRSINPTPRNDKERERIRMMKVLWVKFGRYMSPATTGPEDDGTGEAEAEEVATTDLIFVRFYQRLGNVGIWGFSDGCVQVSVWALVTVENAY